MQSALIVSNSTLEPTIASLNHDILEISLLLTWIYEAAWFDDNEWECGGLFHKRTNLPALQRHRKFLGSIVWVSLLAW
jgi:hypothetical protein